MEELTPVIYEHDFYWKREDFYKFLDLNGSKARFILDTLCKKKNIIKEQYNNTIVVKNKLNSHSLYTQARITEYLNMNLVNIHEIDSYIGTKELQFYKNIQKNNKLLIFSQNNTNGYRFNQKSTDISNYIYTAIINQVKNIPRDIDYFIVYNASKDNYEIHNQSQIGSTYCVTIPYNTLDERTINFVYKTQSKNIEEILYPIEKENKLYEKEEK